MKGVSKNRIAWQTFFWWHHANQPKESLLNYSCLNCPYESTRAFNLIQQFLIWRFRYILRSHPCLSNFLLANRFTEIPLSFWAVVLQTLKNGPFKCQLFWISCHNVSSCLVFHLCGLYLPSSIFLICWMPCHIANSWMVFHPCEFFCTFSKCYTSQISWVTPWAADGFSSVWVLS